MTYGVPEKLKPDLAVVLPGLLLAAMSPAELQKEIKALAERLVHRPAWLAGLLALPLNGGAALALRIVMQWLPIATEIRQYITPQLQALLKEFTVLHHSPDFKKDLDNLEKNIREGVYASQQSVEQIVDELRKKARDSAEALKRYYVLCEQTPKNSTSYEILQKWQSRLQKPNYNDINSLREDLMRSYRRQIIVQSWQQPDESVNWECKKSQLGGCQYHFLSTKADIIAFSPDGQLLATSGSRLELWQVKDRRCVAELKWGNKSWSSVVFSPDGRLLACCNNDTIVHLWRVEDQQDVGTLRSPGGKYSSLYGSMAFSPDGQLLASDGGDSVRLWRIEDQKCVAILPLSEPEHFSVRAVAFSPDGRLLAIGGGGGYSVNKQIMLQLWRVEDRQCVVTLQGHTDDVNAVAFSPDGWLLASGSDDNTVRLWRVEDRQCVATLQGHTDAVNAVAFSPDGRLLASGSADGTMRLWRVEDWQCVATLEDRQARLFTLEGHTKWVKAVAFSPDGRLLASGGSEIFLWSPHQIATVEMTLEQLIAWEKEYAGRYGEIQVVE